MLNELPSKVVMSGGMHLLLGLGHDRWWTVRTTLDHRRQRPAMSSSLAAARRDAIPAASARRLDSNALLSASVKENVQQTE